MTLFEISINPRIINKNEKGDTEAFAIGWNRVLLDQTGFIDSIRNGVAYCAQMKGIRRKAEQYRQTNVASVDIDDSTSISEAMAHPLVRDQASFLYTTCSHSPDKPRFRIVFLLERAISDPERFAQLLRGLAQRLGGDPSATDAARVSYGNTRAEVFNLGKNLCDATVEELIAQGARHPKAPRSGEHTQATVISKLALSWDQEVVTADGELMVVRDAASRTTIHCPFHNDQHASAFITVSQQGVKGIHCSACNASFWPQGAPLPELATVEEVLSGTHKASLPLEGAESFVREAHLISLDARYVGSLLPSTPITLVKSGKGTGKTTALKTLCESFDGRILLVGHRTTLLQGLAARLGLVCYLDRKVDGVSVNWNVQDRFAVSLDSLATVDVSRAYDLVIFDESEQVLAHFLSDTMKEKRLSNLLRLRKIVADAEHVIALDADLNWTTATSLFQWRQLAGRPAHAEVIVNSWIDTEKRELTLFPSRKEIEAEVLNCFQRGGRTYVACSSKRTADRLARAAERCFSKKQILLITAASRKGHAVEIERFLKNPATESLRYQAIVVSPALSSGTDISFDGVACVDDAFGIFEHGTLNHLLCDQQLSRVRKPLRTHVWIAPLREYLDLTPDVIKLNLKREYMFGHLVAGLNENGQPVFRPDDELLELATSVEMVERQSRLDIKQNFIRYKERQGWTVTKRALSEVPVEQSGKLGLDAMLTVNSLTDHEYDDVGNRMEEQSYVSEEETVRLRRTKLERFFKVPFEQVVGILRIGITPSAIRNFVETSNARKDLSPSLALGPGALKGRGAILALAFESAGILSQGQFLPNHEFSKGDLGSFAETMIANQVLVTKHLDLVVGPQTRANPVKFLGRLLDHVGLATVSRATKRNRRKSYIYRLDDQRLSSVLAVVEWLNPTQRISIPKG